MPNIEELLRKAMEEGKFDDLPGKGKPLDLGEHNPYADPDWELAYKMLKDGGYSLPWIELMHEIEVNIEAARKELKLAWEWRREAIATSQPSSSIFAEWDRAQKTFKVKIITLNKRIRDYNLQVPSPRFQRPVLNVEQELQKITSN